MTVRSKPIRLYRTTNPVSEDHVKQFAGKISRYISAGVMNHSPNHHAIPQALFSISQLKPSVERGQPYLAVTVDGGPDALEPVEKALRGLMAQFEMQPVSLKLESTIKQQRPKVEW